MWLMRLRFRLGVRGYEGAKPTSILLPGVAVLDVLDVKLYRYSNCPLGRKSYVGKEF